MARDAFSLAHFPMLCGVIAYAVALEDAIAHPSDPLLPAARLALALGMLLFLSGSAFAMWRATYGYPLSKITIAAFTAGAVAALPTVPAAGALAMAFTSVVAVALLDERRARRLHI